MATLAGSSRSQINELEQFASLRGTILPKFLTTSAISYEIERLLIEAKREIVLISPFLQLSKTLYERLRDCERRGVALRIVYGKNDLKDEERAILEKLNSLELFYLKNLHAKCYYNESELVLGSMNMYQFSEKTNREMGILITSRADRRTFEAARKEVESIVNAAESKKIPKTGEQTRSQNSKKTKTSGSCIRCGDALKFNQLRPLCRDCFGVWFQFENEDYEENYCHGCGDDVATSMAEPMCQGCASDDY